MQSMRAAHSVITRALILVATALSAAILPRPVAAQILRGTVRDSTSRAPIPGAVLILLDSAGASLGRNITNDRGQYSIALHPSMTRLQVLRIGFRPRALRIPDAVDGAVQLDVVMAAIPRLLESVSVIDQPNCPRRNDRTTAFALWEQARSALLAVVVAREANPAQVMRLHSIRRLDDADRILAQQVAIDSASTTRPFAATRTAADFVQRGFSYDSAGSTWYNGPDAETLLDDAFVRGYCFHVAGAEAARPGQVGLAFSPANRRRGRIDIEGTVWVDSTNLSLTDIVFKFLGTPSIVEKVRPGGKVSFRTMENGTVIIDRWALRSAGPLQAQMDGDASMRRILSNAVPQIKETGGEVAYARWPDGREWRAPLGTVRGALADSAGAGVQIRLIDTDYRAVTDSAGRFEISYLLPGPYRIGVVDPELASIDMLLVSNTEFTAIRDSMVSIKAAVPNANDYALSICSVGNGTLRNAVLVARVELPNGAPAAGANVEVRASADGNMRRVAEGRTDRNGIFGLCHVPPGVELTLHVERAGMQPASVITEVLSRIHPVKIKLQAKP
jgi:hypothetical protein